MVLKFEEYINERFTDQGQVGEYSVSNNKLRHVTFKEGGYKYNICYNRGDVTDYPIRQIIDDLLDNKHKYERVWELITIYLIKFCKDKDTIWRRLCAAASYFVRDNQIAEMPEHGNDKAYPILKSKINDDEILLKAMLCGFSHKQMNVTTQGKEIPDEFSPLFFIYNNMDNKKETLLKYSSDKLYDSAIKMVFMGSSEGESIMSENDIDITGDPDEMADKFRAAGYFGHAAAIDYYSNREDRENEKSED